jgi:CubicO group peptidase (beta-lactamase class C family)
MLLFVLSSVYAGAPRDWSAVDAVLQSAVDSRVTPGLAAGVRDASGHVVYYAAFGSLTYGEPTPLGMPNSKTSTDTLFDMASCSKIIGVVSAAARLYELGFLRDLDAAISEEDLLGAVFAQKGKAAITVRNLLLHDAGFPPDPAPGYADDAFGCPATSKQPHPPLSLSCVEKIFTSVLAQPLARPVGSAYIYSDLSMVTLLFVVGRVAQRERLVSPADFDLARLGECAHADPPGGLYLLCAYEAYWRLNVKPLLFANASSATSYLIPANEWPRASPTYADTEYRHEVMQGVVADSNAYAHGGVAGHAGIFSTVGDVLNFTAVWQPPPSPVSPTARLLNATTIALWTKAPNATFSPRALGWITQASTDPYQGCGSLSPETFYHTGYTGTLMCLDPRRNVSTVLLTTRVYPNMSANVDGVLALRRNFNDAVLSALAGEL